MALRKAGRLAGGALLLIAIAYGIIRFLRAPAGTPFLQGKRLAEANGSFACHGPGGVSGIPNPKGEVDVPAWDGGNAEMYLETDADIREFIVKGRLAREGHDHEHDSVLIRMPACGEFLGGKRLDALTAYVKAVSAFYPEMPDTARKGMAAARANYVIVPYRSIRSLGIPREDPEG